MTPVAKNGLILVMSAASAIADPNPSRTRLRLAALNQWAAAGVAMAKALVSQGERNVVDAVRTLARITQAVRLAIALAMRLSQPDNPAFQPVPARPRTARPAVREGARENAPTDKPARQRRRGVADRELSDAAILRRPLGEIVKRICANLGIVPDWSLWSDDGATAKGAAGPAELAPEPDRALPAVVLSPNPLRPSSAPRPRPGLILDRPTKPPPTEPRRLGFSVSCAPGALIPTLPPIAPWRAVDSGCP